MASLRMSPTGGYVQMESIDPLKEAKANEVEIETGAKSRRFIVESQGWDFDKQRSVRKKKDRRNWIWTMFG